MNAEPATRWYRRLSLRTRILLISSLAVGVVLAVGGVLLLALIRAELIDTADDAGSDAAENVAALAKSITLPPVLAPTEEVAAAVQVVGADYRAAIAFLILIAVLLVKPSGLFGGRA